MTEATFRKSKLSFCKKALRFCYADDITINSRGAKISYIETKGSAPLMNLGMIGLFILTMIIMLFGLAGTILPMIPGLPIMWAGAFLYALLTGFEKIGWTYLGIFALLTAITTLLDYVANLYGAKKMGATRWGLAGAFLGMLVGLFAGGLIGILLGSFIGAILGELLAGRKGTEALMAGVGTFLGFLGGTLLKFVIGCVMIGTFLWQILF
jgi:uncharacterized protein YqgC (DUF456 family)